MTRRRIAPSRHTAALAVGWGARASWIGLLLALLCLQQLGLSHRYAHGVVPGAVAVAEHPQLATGNDLLPAHDQTACQLLDQLCTGDAAPAAAVVALPMRPVSVLPPAPRVVAHSGQTTPFWARAPPAAA